MSSNSSPYVRPTLTATRAGVADGQLLIDLWLDQLSELVEDIARGDAPPGPGDAYEVVALFGRLRRTATGAAGSALLDRVEKALEGWVPQALEVPDPDGWLAEAGDLADACDLADPETDLAGWAEELLTDLDDADLVAWAARGQLPAELEAGLARCADWLRDNPDRFFPAGVFIQGVGQTIRSDLPSVDLDLAGTADKFVLLLDALDEIQERMDPDPGRVHLPRGGWEGFPEPALALAAATRGQGGLFRRRWRSPEGTLTALLVVDPDGPGRESVRINFLAGDDPATGLAGVPVWLAGCAAVCDAGGNADFARPALLAARQAGLPLDLCVGPERQVWELMGDE